MVLYRGGDTETVLRPNERPGWFFACPKLPPADCPREIITKDNCGHFKSVIDLKIAQFESPDPFGKILIRFRRCILFL